MNLREILEEEYRELVVHYFKLNSPKEEKYGFSISGSLDLRDPYTSKIWDTYSIRIEISSGYPTFVPITFETSEKIERILDNHISERGKCCLAPRLEEIEILGNNYRLIDYINKLVLPFFASYKLNELGENSESLGEYSHYGKGIIEYYMEKWDEKDIQQILTSLNILVNNIKYHRNDTCYCKSGKKYKNCHERLIRKYMKVNRKIFLQDILDINKSLKKQTAVNPS